MITAATNNTVERVGTSSEQVFKIKANAKAFKILSSNLYTDKVTAIIRELSCNAADSHIQANNPEPFLIHLPNNFEPWFSIRDYGVGLSDASIYNIFTTYFESTKTDSNDLIGCLGLGSKSPFSYTDNFIVTSFYNNVKSTYSAFENESGIPSISRLSEETTDEHNGVEINFAVQRNDFYQFKDACKSVFKYFKLLPKIVGCDVVIEKQTYAFNRTGWGVRSQSNYDSGVRVVMGNVCYKLQNYSDETLTKSERSILETPIDLFMNIGDVDVAASRESISLDVATKKNIREKIVNTHKEIVSEVETSLKTCNNMYEAKCFYNNIKNCELSCIKTIISNIKFEFDGTSVENGVVNFSQKTQSTYEVYQFQKKGWRSKSKYRTIKTDYIKAVSKNEYFLLDSTRCIKPRFIKWLETNATREAENFFYINVTGSTGKEDFITALGVENNYNLNSFSTLPYDKVTSISNGYKNPKTKCQILELVDARYHKAIDSWVETTVDLNDGGVYIPISHYKIGNDTPHVYFEEKLNTLKEIGVTTTKIYGVKEKLVKNLANKPNWINFDVWYNAKVTDFIKPDSGIVERVNYYTAVEKAKELLYSHTQHGIEGYYLKQFAEKTQLYKVIKMETEDQKIVDLIANNQTEPIKIIINNVKPDAVVVEKLSKVIFNIFVKILDRYPMLAYSNHITVNHLSDYIELVNSCSVTKVLTN